VERKRGRLKKGKPYERENRSTNIQCNVCPRRRKAFAHHLHVSFHIFGSLRVRPKKGTGHKEVQTRNCCEVTVCHKAKRQKAFKMSWGRGFWVSKWTELLSGSLSSFSLSVSLGLSEECFNVIMWETQFGITNMCRTRIINQAATTLT